MVPRGGDELNLIEPGKNYGWPLVSYATNYNGVPIPSPDTRPDLTKPVIYWTPIIAPGNLTFYKGSDVPAMERLGPDGRHGDHDAQPHRRRRRARPSRPSAGMSATASAMWKSRPTARCGCWKTPIPAGCSADAEIAGRSETKKRPRRKRGRFSLRCTLF